MSFDYKLAKEIYGVPWSVDKMSFMSLSSILRNLQNGVALDIPEVKLNSISLLEVSNETRIIKNTWNLNNTDSFEGIGVINLNGPITKNGGTSSYGTKDLSKQMLQMSRDSRVKGFIIMADSGGGSSAAVTLMQEAINEVKAKKPVYAVVEKGGMAGSACYGIISACTGIYSEDGMNIVGSAGTMIQFSGKPNGTVDQDGEKHIVLYATKSTEKNKDFEQAIEKDNYKLIIDNLLDPVNENFLQSIISNRPILAGSKYDDGHTVFSKDAVGSFIDGIASFDEVVSMILSDSGTESNSNNNNLNSNKMTKAELKQNHPELYSEIVAEGVTSEQERVASWMAYNEADPKAVAEGISSNKPISQPQSHAFLVAIAQKGKVDALIADNAPAINTPESATEEVELTAKEKELASAMDFELKKQ
jgi:ClpP class serine protease